MSVQQHYEHNKDAKKFSMKQYYERNKDTKLVMRKLYYQQNKECTKIYHKNYYTHNRDKLACKAKLLYSSNREFAKLALKRARKYYTSVPAQLPQPGSATSNAVVPPQLSHISVTSTCVPIKRTNEKVT